MVTTPNSYGARLRESNDCHEPAGSDKGGQFCSKEGSADRIAELRRIIKEPVGMTRKKPGLGRMDDPESYAQQHQIRRNRIRRHKAKRELARLERERQQTVVPRVLNAIKRQFANGKPTRHNGFFDMEEATDIFSTTSQKVRGAVAAAAEALAREGLYLTYKAGHRSPRMTTTPNYFGRDGRGTSSYTPPSVTWEYRKP